MNHYMNFRNALEKEIESLNYFLSNVDQVIVQEIVEVILKIKGKVVISGIGKSGIIGAKIAATFASTGTESIFVHSTEAFHGDLGMINNNDLLILISFSGNTDEVVKVLKFGNDNNIPSISLTGNSNSILACNSSYHLTVEITEEACPLKLAPTSSTTTTLAIGDALAISLMKARGFKQMDFAKYHPGGSLGRKLLFKAKDIINTRIPKVSSTSTVLDAIMTISNEGMGFCLVYENNKLLGIVTDGDIRRFFLKNSELNNEQRVTDVLTTNPISISEDSGINECEQMLNEKKINILLVHNKENNIIGVITRFELN